MDFLKGCRCNSVKVVMGRSLGTPGPVGAHAGKPGATRPMVGNEAAHQTCRVPQVCYAVF